MKNKETLISYWTDYLVRKNMDKYHAKETAMIIADEIEEVGSKLLAQMVNGTNKLDLALAKEYGYLEPTNIISEKSDELSENEKLQLSNERMADALYMFSQGEKCFADSHKDNWTLDFVKKTFNGSA